MGWKSFRKKFRPPKPPKIKLKIKIPKIKIDLPKIKPPKIDLPKLKPPKIVKDLQKAGTAALNQGKTNLQSATTTARSNVHGVTTAARTGLHDATTDAKGVATKVATGVKTAWDKARGKDKEATGGGGTGADVAAMGSDSGVKEDSKVGESGKKFDTCKKKRLDTKKDKLKVKRRTGPQ